MTALDDHDRRVIADARELAALATTAAVQQRFPGWGDSTAYVEAFHTARLVLGDLARLAERLDGAAQDARRLAEIRALLARFDWERDDRQYALEAIERIVEDQ